MDYISIGCCVLAFVLYLNNLHSGFVYDDRRAILSNIDVVGRTAWHKAFYHDYWGTPLTDTGSHGSYRPFCVLSFRLNFILGGYSAWGYHFINNVLHCVATGLVVKVARQLLSSVWGVTLTGALFAVHPIHTEAVSGIVGRADIATCIFYLLTFLSYTQHIILRSKADHRQWYALILTILTAAAALLFKETGITALLACGIFDIICSIRNCKNNCRLRSLFIILSASMCFVYMRLVLIPQPQTVFSAADNPIAKINSAWTRFLTFIYLPVYNFKLLLYPNILSFDWGMDAIPCISSITDKRNILSGIFYGALIFLFWLCYNVLFGRPKFIVQSNKLNEIGSTSSRDSGVQYHLQAKFPRKSRLKQKYSKWYKPQGSLLLINWFKPNFHYATDNHTVPYWKRKGFRYSNQIQSCVDTKEHINSTQTLSSCEILNNNNILNIIPTSRHNNYCFYQNFNISSRIGLIQSISLILQKTIPSAVIGRGSRSSSSCSNSTTTSNRSTESSSSSTCDFTSFRCLISNADKSTNLENILITQGACSFSYISPLYINSCALFMSLVFLTVPFLPATNMFFYVGFVVAERLLYLPSVGFCLLVGFGISKLIEQLSLNGRNGVKYFIILGICILLCVLSMRTILRNFDWKDEESLYRSAIMINPPKALGNLGSVLSSQSRYKEAELVLLEAIKFRPNMADAHFNLGVLYQNQQRFKEAVESFRNALYFRPQLAAAYLNLGISLIALGNCQEALKILQDGTKVDGSGVRDRISHDNARISSYLQIGALYTKQEKIYRALAIYREALHEFPRNYYMRNVLHYRIGDLFSHLKQWNEAETHYHIAVNLKPNEPRAYLSYGTILSRNSCRIVEAEQWFKRALLLAPEQASVFHHYAEFLTSQSRHIEAISNRIKAAELEPNDYSLMVSVATALRLADRKTEAKEWYRKAVSLRPRDAHAHTNLGAILHLLGDRNKAMESYKEALKLQPGDLMTLNNLAKLGLANMK